MLTKYLIGFIEDNAGFFIIPRLISGLKGCSDFIGYPSGICLNLFADNQPFTLVPTHLLAKVADPVLIYNLFVLGGLVLNFLFTFRFFSKIFGRFKAFLLATVFITSPYFAYQSRSHVDLIHFWPVVLFLDTLFFYNGRYKAIVLGLLLTLITGISNYLGYFTLLFTVIFTVLSSRTSKGITRQFVTTAIVFALSSSFFIAPYIMANYSPFQVRVEEQVSSRTVRRPIEDFVTFSSRPWYYFLPSVDNPFFGSLSQNFLTRLSSKGAYLTQNYFKAEHSASYLGWVNMSLALVGAISLLIKKQPINISAPLSYSALLMSVVGLIVLTMPPFITTGGAVIYTPSYILFRVFPMFRVLSRMSGLVLFLTLIFTGYGYVVVENLLVIKTPNHHKFRVNLVVTRLIFAILAFISVVEFFIPPKITHVGVPPKVYSYIEAASYIKSPVVVYPYNKTNQAIFWMTVYKQPLINPRTYENTSTSFISEEFTKLLNTTYGLENARRMGARYMVYFYTADGGESTNFFNQSEYLTKINEFEENDQSERLISLPQMGSSMFTIMRIVEAGSAKSNSAILYEFR